MSTRMSPEDEARRIFAARAVFYATSASQADPKVLARVVALAAPEPHWVALDIATGAGHTAFAVCEKVRTVIATDLTIEMLRQAEMIRMLRGITNVSIGVANVHSLPFRPKAFHLITCRRAAHHFSRVAGALDEMHRVLVPSGRVVIDDRSIPEDDFVDATMNLLDTFHDPSHVREYRPSEWRTLLESHGFVIEALECYVKHRPLTAFTGKASPEGQDRIQALVSGLTAAQRQALNLCEVNGEMYCNHWYVTIASRKL